MKKITGGIFSSTDSLVSLILGLAVVLGIGLLIVRALPKNFSPFAPQPQKPAEQPETTTELNTYTVKQNDTLWGIAVARYNDGYKWTEIQKANNIENADYIEVGQVLTLPKLAEAQQGEISATSTETPATQAKNYTVVRGDTLWNVASRMYNDGYKWVDIAKTNNLANPDLIHSGNVLRLP